MTTSTEPSASPRTVWTLVLASLGAFLTSLDVVVVSTALPTLQDHLHASLADLEWTINGYNLAFACLMLTGAALGDRFGRRNVYVLGVGVFTLSSIACATAGSTSALIAARVVQGAGAAVVLPLTLTLISNAFPLEKRGAAIGIWGAITGLGVAAGPVLGGLIIQDIAWQWIFWINVPVGLAVMVLCMVMLRDSRGLRPQLDLVGVALVSTALFALVWAPVRAPSVGWGDPQVIGALLVGVVLMAVFLMWQRRARYPMLPLRYFRSRGFSTANAVVFFMMFSLIGSLFMIAQMFQLGLGYDPLQAGLRLLVWTGMPMLVAPLAGALSDRFGNRPFMVLGLLLQGAGLLWLALVSSPDAGYGTLVVPLVLAGVGISMTFPTVANAVVGAVPLEDSGVAAGTNNTVREAGGVFGVAVLVAVFAAHGGYGSPASFMDGFKAAEIVAAVAAAAGAAVAVLAPGKRQADAANPNTAPSSDTLPQAERV
ncbi:MFS transporter [Streptomyces cocklensis]|uniref:Drug resistance transporter, EmrB/QacA subfamily n=1 Tax=Actinacidiphila cocklensis TaxID=887465 RepID=A0A9W4E2A1_9ACTN|nr:MFS transporter [Actinacidiphila cocklensis]MDD1062218.1 MFS transporter [Actinacidiphila cocklensis]CAG6391337.1 Drug resistance transporter, EmrB/QacA subfamily [Actinacidiphila cocklensis]